MQLKTNKSNGMVPIMIFMAILPILWMLVLVAYSFIRDYPFSDLVPFQIVPCIVIILILVMITLLKSYKHFPQIQNACPIYNIGMVNLKKVQKYLEEINDVENVNKLSELLNLRNMLLCFFLGTIISVFLLMLIMW